MEWNSIDLNELDHSTGDNGKSIPCDDERDVRTTQKYDWQKYDTCLLSIVI